MANTRQNTVKKQPRNEAQKPQEAPRKVWHDASKFLDYNPERDESAGSMYNRGGYSLI